MSTSSLDMNSFPFLSLSATLTQRNEYLFLFSSLVSGAAAKLPCKDALENTDIENKVGEIYSVCRMPLPSFGNEVTVFLPLCCINSEDVVVNWYEL